MKRRSCIKVIVEKRNDAIYVCNKSLISSLKKIGANVKVIFVDNKKFKNSFFNFILEIINTIKTIFLINKDDIVIFTDPQSFNLISALVLPNKKYVIFYHYEKDPFYYRLIPFVTYKKVLRKMNGVICISKFSQSQVIKLGVELDKCKVIYCGLDHKLFKPSDDKKYDFEYILVVGSEEPRKNMKNILRAVKKIEIEFPNIKILKAGYVSEKNRIQTKKYIKRYRVSENIVFENFVDENELPLIYSKAKLLLYPSLLEGFGLPIIEAMACGCPVVTSNINPMKELVEKSQLTVNPYKSSEIADACISILKNEKLRNKLITDGIEMSKRFDWIKNAKETVEFISR